jgi:ribosomal protein L34E
LASRYRGTGATYQTRINADKKRVGTPKDRFKFIHLPQLNQRPECEDQDILQKVNEPRPREASGFEHTFTRNQQGHWP